MAFRTLWLLALRDLGRNRRRTLLALLAVALGLALLLFLNGYIAGVTEDSLQNSIRLRTGHVQVRAESYRDEKVSLQWKDLIADLDSLLARVNSMEGVVAVAPVLWAGGVLNTAEDGVGLQIVGIDPDSALYAPIREAVKAGNFLTADDRSGILVGRRLADSMGIGVDSSVAVTVVDADGAPQEAIFTVRGLFSTGIVSYDESSILMPLAKAQALTHTEDRATALVMLLDDQERADSVAAALAGPGLSVQTWADLNRVFLETLGTAVSFYWILDAIVMLIVAVIIANTLLMSVFERIREMGILAALGMKGRQLLQMLLCEAVILGAAGSLLGMILGGVAVWFLTTKGIYVGEDIAGSAGSAFALGATLYGRFVPSQFVTLSFWTVVVTVLASLYPAWFAARLEPVDALRAL